MWNTLDISTKSLGLSEFKEKLKENLKPNRFKHYSCGSKIGNTLLTRIRLDRSDLNLHRYTIGSSDSPECACHAKQESSYHYIIDCFLYDCERQILFDSVEYFIPNFEISSKMTQVVIKSFHSRTNTSLTFLFP